jgi:ribosomal protein L19
MVCGFGVLWPASLFMFGTSPFLDKIVVNKEGSVRRARLFYLSA